MKTRIDQTKTVKTAKARINQKELQKINDAMDYHKMNTSEMIRYLINNSSITITTEETDMSQVEQTIYVDNLKNRVRSVLTSALNHFNLINLNSEFDEYQTMVDEYEAGLEMVDQLVSNDDYFTSTLATDVVMKAILYYSSTVDEHSFIKSKIDKLAADIETTIKAAKEASR